MAANTAKDTEPQVATSDEGDSSDGDEVSNKNYATLAQLMPFLTIIIGAGLALMNPDLLFPLGRQPGNSGGAVTKPTTMRIFTVEDLSKYSGAGKTHDGDDDLSNTPIYLAIVGHVFDVTAGRAYYGDGGGYSFFSGTDGARAFVSGNFSEDGVVDTVDDFDYEQILGVEHWLKFYQTENEGQKYFQVGLLVGRYFDREGQPTKAMHMYWDRVKEAKAYEEKKKQETNVWPNCDSRWEQGKGTTYSCLHDKVPRKLTPLIKYDKTIRCACFKKDDLSPPPGKSIAVYPGCDAEDSLCKVPDSESKGDDASKS
jgi:predicted heme/steroid binding protein